MLFSLSKMWFLPILTLFLPTAQPCTKLDYTHVVLAFDTSALNPDVKEFEKIRVFTIQLLSWIAAKNAKVHTVTFGGEFEILGTDVSVAKADLLKIGENPDPWDIDFSSAFAPVIKKVARVENENFDQTRELVKIFKKFDPEKDRVLGIMILSSYLSPYPSRRFLQEIYDHSQAFLMIDFYCDVPSQDLGSQICNPNVTLKMKGGQNVYERIVQFPFYEITDSLCDPVPTLVPTTISTELPEIGPKSGESPEKPRIAVWKPRKIGEKRRKSDEKSAKSGNKIEESKEPLRMEFFTPLPEYYTPRKHEKYTTTTSKTTPTTTTSTTKNAILLEKTSPRTTKKTTTKAPTSKSTFSTKITTFTTEESTIPTKTTTFSTKTTNVSTKTTKLTAKTTSFLPKTVSKPVSTHEAESRNFHDPSTKDSLATTSPTQNFPQYTPPNYDTPPLIHHTPHPKYDAPAPSPRAKTPQYTPHIPGGSYDTPPQSSTTQTVPETTQKTPELGVKSGRLESKYVIIILLVTIAIIVGIAVALALYKGRKSGTSSQKHLSKTPEEMESLSSGSLDQQRMSNGTEKLALRVNQF